MGFTYYDSDSGFDVLVHGITMGFNYYECNALAHHGILGMKWGVRRYQNPDGTLTAAGRERLEKYKAKASNLRKSEAKMRYGRLKTEEEGKANGEAHATYSKLEAKDKKHAEKYERKAKKIEQRSFFDQLNNIGKNSKHGSGYENTVYKKGQDLIPKEKIAEYAKKMRKLEIASLRGKPVFDHEGYNEGLSKSETKLVDDLLGDYKNKRLHSSKKTKQQAEKIVRRIISDAASDMAFKEGFDEFVRKYGKLR